MASYYTTQVWVFPESTNLVAATETFSQTQLKTPILHNNPQVVWWNKDEERIGIDSVRELQQVLGFRAQTAETRFVVILRADLLTDQAQHALLKTLEEPGEHTQVILVVTQEQRLLPTILSRVISVIADTDNTTAARRQELDQGKELYERWTELRIDEIIEESARYKNRELASSAVRNIVLWLHHSLQQKSTHNTQLIIAHTQHALSCLEALDANANVRLAVEHFMFLIAGHTRA